MEHDGEDCEMEHNGEICEMEHDGIVVEERNDDSRSEHWTAGEMRSDGRYTCESDHGSGVRRNSSSLENDGSSFATTIENTARKSCLAPQLSTVDSYLIDKFGASTRLCADDEFRNVTLYNVLPCNLLRQRAVFVLSEYRMKLSQAAIDNFVRLFGFFMDERESKFEFLRERSRTNGPNEKTSGEDRAALLNVLSSCRTNQQLRECLDHTIARTNVLLDCGMNMFVLSSKKEDKETLDAFGGPKEMLRITEYAKNSLVQFRDSMVKDNFIGTLLATEAYCRQLIHHADAKRDLIGSCERVWMEYKDHASMTYDQMLSVIVQDAVTTTALRTQMPLLMCLRMSAITLFFAEEAIMFMFEVSRNILKSPSSHFSRTTSEIAVDESAAIGSDTQLRVLPTNEELSRFAQNTEYAHLARDYMTQYFPADAMFSTIVMFIYRSYLSNCLEWPMKIIEMFGTTIDIESWQRTLVNELLRQQAQNSHASYPRWLSVRRGPSSFKSQGERYRVYANFSTLIGMFERMSQLIDSNCQHQMQNIFSRLSGNSDNRSGGDVNGDVRAKSNDALGYLWCNLSPSLVLRTTDRTTRLQYENYNQFLVMCRDKLVKNFTRTVDGRTIEEFTRAYLVEFEQTDTASASDGSASVPKTSYDVNDICDSVAEGIADVLGMVTVSYLRYDVREKRYVDLNVFRGISNAEGTTNNDERSTVLSYDPDNEGFKLQLVAMIAKLHKSKVTYSKVDRLMERQIAIWNERIGVCNGKQMTEILSVLMKLMGPSEESPVA